MVVIVIVAALLGLGLGSLRRVDGADRRAVMQVKDAMRAARLLAVGQGAPASLVVDADAHEVYAMGLRTVGNWHFEDAEGTGWPVPVDHPETALQTGGVLGWRLRLEEDVAHVRDPPPTFDSPHGFGLDLWVAPADDPRPMTILERPGRWSLGFDFQGDLELAVSLVPEQAEGLADDAPETFRHAWPGVDLPSGRLTRVTVVFDGRNLHLAVDGRRAAEDTVFPTRRRLAGRGGEPMRTGDGPTRFRGDLDELRLFSVVVADHERLPDEVELLGGSRVVRVAASGHLDPAFHGAPEIVEMTLGDPAVDLFVEYGLLGTVESWTERRDGERP